MDQNNQPVQPQQQPIYAQPVQQPIYAQQVQQQYYPQVDTQPLSVGQYIVMFIVMGLPLIGFIMTLVWAFGSNVNLNKKNFCRAYLIIAIIAIILSIVFSIVFATAFTAFFEQMSSY